jgi:N-acetyl-anhydromuramyl-L-alanine amidase AmpD
VTLRTSDVAIIDNINTLPKNPTAQYPSRSLSQITQIIIHHSAVSPTIGPERLARTQIRQGRPGLSYHFFVANDGKIYRTNPLTTVTAHAAGHDQNSLAICFAGNFTQHIPNPAQLQAGGKLIYTLMKQLNISLDHVKGASELIPTQSPGKQWLAGERWKDRLLGEITASAVEPQPAEVSPPPSPQDEQHAILQARIAQINTQLAQAQAANQAAQQQIASLHDRIAQLSNQLAQNEDQAGQITALNNRIAQLESELAQARSRAQTTAASAAQIAALNARIAQLEVELAQARSNGWPASPISSSLPRIQNVVDRLPRHETKRFPTRNPAEINMIVIHHTAVPASVSAERIAKIQVDRGKPGITYHYYIEGDGTILQTNPDNSVTQHTSGYDQTSLAVGFAGNFTDVVPTNEQLRAGAELLAYLQERYNIPQENIKGATELINTQSPGKQWLTGQKWKNLLLAEMSALPIGETHPGAPTTNGNGQITALQARIAELETQLGIAQEAIISIGGIPASNPPLASGSVVSQPVLEDIVADLSHHQYKHYQMRPISAIKTIIIHHSATPASISAEQIAAFHVNKNDWPGFGFHYFIRTDGVIQQTNDLTSISYHAGNQNPTSIGVAFAGDFDDNLPAQAQITAGAHLIAWLLDHLNLPLTAVEGHKKFAHTTCPGKEWDKGATWRNTLLQAIQNNLAGAGVKGVGPEGKTIFHYMLFWQTETDWAKKDLTGAMNYIGKFRPSLGFSLEDALEAEYVTIIGGPLGISVEDEARLKASGCKVERVAGNSELATQALLDNLVRQNQRFLTFQYPGGHLRE